MSLTGVFAVLAGAGHMTVRSTSVVSCLLLVPSVIVLRCFPDSA